MSRLIVVSNRLPKKIKKGKGGLKYKDVVGGLATGLQSFKEKHEVLWIGWPGIPRSSLTRSQRDKVEKDLGKEKLTPVFMSRHEIDNFYHGFCNKTIWPLFHYFTQYAEYRQEQWSMYEKINRDFLETLKSVYKPGDMVWVHDYHLMLLPKMIRDELESPNIGFFLHIPFPSYEVFRLFPWRRELLEGLLGSDLVGFHTYDYVSHFLKSSRRIVGMDHNLGTIEFGDHLCKADAFPMGIDYDKFSSGVKEKAVENEIEIIKEKVGDRKIILSIDRLDYSKGILSRLESFDRFLETYPEYREKVTMILVAVPSREKVDQYEKLKSDLDEMVGCIEGKYGTIGWTPVWYIYRFLPFETLLALYRSADICLVTPLRDGMNLMAKEYIASRTEGDGVLILSEMAGSAHEMGEALIVNPNNYMAVAEAIKEALEMRKGEMKKRNLIMQERLKRYNVGKWGEDFISNLQTITNRNREMHSKRIPEERVRSMVEDYKGCKKRLFLLDYDGTLSHIAETPEQARPDSDVRKLIGALTKKRGNKVVIISGRDRKTLEDWFEGMDVDLCAEHGVWLKDRDKGWYVIEPMRTEWKPIIRELLQIYSDRTPGSFIEEKDHSLVWHYRRTNPDLASVRSKELINDLLDLTANQDLGVMEGKKVIEIRKMGVNKGRAVSRFLNEDDWELVVAMGDDITDEDIFHALPDEAYSIKVGHQPTKARFTVDSVDEIRKLLRELSEN